jgi:transcriptional regulator with XRE-family HTH domain
VLKYVKGIKHKEKCKMNTMGKRIYMKRTENGMTMKQLADRLGVQTSAINKYEKGAVENIKRKTIEDMAKIFKCSPSWLMGFDADMDITVRDDNDLNTLVEIYNDMTTAQKKEALRFMKYITSLKNLVNTALSRIY